MNFIEVVTGIIKSDCAIWTSENETKLMNLFDEWTFVKTQRDEEEEEKEEAKSESER